MTHEECISRLLGSATHDMRNVLAVVRESTGLMDDVLHLDKNVTAHNERLFTAIGHIQEQVVRGAALTESMSLLASFVKSKETTCVAPCDLNKIVQDFCILIARSAKACALIMEAHVSSDPIFADAHALNIFCQLLHIFDICAAAGGNVTLKIAPSKQKEQKVLLITLAEGKNADTVLTALKECSSLYPAPKGWLHRIIHRNACEERKFFLSVD